jgi:hypothetical protein
LIEPRRVWVPPHSRSLGKDAVAWWKANGGHLYEWQELVLEGLLALDEVDKFVAADDGLDVSRQNGKGVILQVVEGFIAFEYGAGHGYEVVMHTAHEFPTSLEHQMRLEAFIQDSPALHAKVKDRGGYVHANGQESIRLKDGTRIVFRARTKGGGRSELRAGASVTRRSMPAARLTRRFISMGSRSRGSGRRGGLSRRVCRGTSGRRRSSIRRS